MPRPKAYDRAHVVRAARDLFWERGYEATSLADLERVTGLNRSSLYQEFGSKHGLFVEALRNYVREIAEPRLAGMRGPGGVVDYFTSLAADLRRGGGRGCLMVNSITELGGLDPDVDVLAAGYRSRITDALAGALRGVPDAGLKASVLTGLVLGILVTARLDVE